MRDQPCTPSQLHLALSNRGLPAADLASAASRLEALADACPADPALRELMDALYLHRTAELGLDPVIQSLRRTRLVRWDVWSTTWEATDTATGQPHLLRVLRPAWQSDPWRARALLRDARALRAALPELRALTDAPPSLSLRCPGPPATIPPTAPPPDAGAWLRMVVASFDHLQRWDRAGLGFPWLSPAELRDDGAALRLCCLTPTADAHAGAAISHVAEVLLAFWQDGPEDPVVGALQALQHHPPRAVRDAAAAIQRALADRLAASRHQIARRARATARARGMARLVHAIDQLTERARPPVGRTCVGTNLDGQPLLLHSDGSRVTWGSEHDAATVAEGAEVDAALVRKVVRHYEAAPISQQHQQQLGADPSLAPRLVRWLVAAQELRTLRLLLR